MYTQSSLLLCNAGQSRGCVQLELVSIFVACWFRQLGVVARKRYLIGLQGARKGPATSELEHLNGRKVSKTPSRQLG
jgi:hypothetical protein